MGKFDYTFSSKIIIFQEVLQFKNVISFCYNKKMLSKLIGEFHLFLLGHISKIIMHSISPIMSA
jgi:hypothetical protein